MAHVWNFSITQDFLNKRCDVALTAALQQKHGVWNPDPPDCLPSRSQIQKHFDQGLITVDGNPIGKSTQLEPGMLLQYTIPEPTPMDLEPRNVAFDLLFEDDHLAVINKPQGLNVHPASSNPGETTLVHGLLYRLKNLSAIGDVYRPGIVHRLDKFTSGVMVVSKTNDAHRGLTDLFSRHAIDRRYWAFSYGCWQLGPSKRVDTGIGRNPNDRHKMMVRELGETGVRQAITTFKPVKNYPEACLIEATLETGRTHQVRVHLNHLSHSVLGDPVYGVPSPNHFKWKKLPLNAQSIVKRLPGQALHARVLGFQHPITAQPMHFEVNPPPYFEELMECFDRS